MYKDTDKELTIGQRFSVLDRTFKRRLDEQLARQGLTGVQFYVLEGLEHLESKQQEVNQRDLERISRVTHPTMADILKRLERKGLIASGRSPSDRRAKLLSTTEEGRRLLRTLNDTGDQVERELCRGLEPGEIQELLKITGRMLENAAAVCEKRRDDRP